MPKRQILKEIHGQDLGLDRHGHLICKGLGFNTPDWDENTDLPVPDDSELEDGETPSGDRLGKAKISITLASEDQSDTDSKEEIRELLLTEFASVLGVSENLTLITDLDRRLGLLENATGNPPPSDPPDTGDPGVTPPDPYALNLVTFDGVNDFLDKAADWNFGSDGKLVTGSVWFKHAEAGVAHSIVDTANNRFQIKINANDKLQIVGKNAAGITILDVESSALNTATGLHQAAWSFDMAGGAARRHLYIDGAEDLATVTTFTDDAIDFTDAPHYIASDGGSLSSGVGAATFDGSNDYALRGGNLTGCASAKTFTASIWFRRSATGSTQRILRSDNLVTFSMGIETTNKMLIQARNAAGTTILSAETAAVFTNTTDWQHVVISIDLTDDTKRAVYVNGVLDATTWGQYVNDTIDFSNITEWGVGATPGAAQLWNGSLADLLFKDGTYVDLSQAANRQKIYNAGYVSPGADGSTFLGVAARLYITGAASVWNAGTNGGTGGNVTMTGATVDASTTPGAGASAALYRGELDQLLIKTAAYLDLSDIANLVKFYNSGAVQMGTNGADPFSGSPPDVFIQGPKAEWNQGNNRGTGGAYIQQGSVVNVGESEDPGSSGKLTRAQMQGVWPYANANVDGLSPTALDQQFRDTVAAEQAKDPTIIKGIVFPLTWYLYETADNVFNDQMITDLVADAKSNFGDDIKIGLHVRWRSFKPQGAENPNTAGPPGYIVSDHVTYGGSSGAGGLYFYDLNFNGSPGGKYYITRMHDAAVMTKYIRMLNHLIATYNDHPNIKIIMAQESSLTQAPTNDPTYDFADFNTQAKRLMDETVGNATSLHLGFWTNFVAGDQNGIREIYDHAHQVGFATGTPDLQGGQQEFGYYDILDDGKGPNDCSLQWQSYVLQNNGQMTFAQCMNTGINRLKMRLFMPQDRGPDGAADFIELMDTIRGNPTYVNWARGDVIP